MNNDFVSEMHEMFKDLDQEKPFTRTVTDSIEKAAYHGNEALNKTMLSIIHSLLKYIEEVEKIIDKELN